MLKTNGSILPPRIKCNDVDTLNVYIEDDLKLFFENFQKEEKRNDKYVIIADCNIFLKERSTFFLILTVLLTKGEARRGSSSKESYIHINENYKLDKKLSICSTDIIYCSGAVDQDGVGVVGADGVVDRGYDGYCCCRGLDQISNRSACSNDIYTNISYTMCNKKCGPKCNEKYSEGGRNKGRTTNSSVEMIKHKNILSENKKRNRSDVEKYVQEENTISEKFKGIIKQMINNHGTGSFEIGNVLIIVLNMKKYLDKSEKCKEFGKMLQEISISSKNELICFADTNIMDLLHFTYHLYFKGKKLHLFPLDFSTAIKAACDTNSCSDGSISGAHGTVALHSFEVYILTSLFKTSNAKEHKRGLSEALRLAILNDKNMFIRIKKNDLNYFVKNLKYFLNKCILNIRDIIKKGENNAKYIHVLSFGNTIGNAIKNVIKNSPGCTYINDRDYINYGIFYELKIMYELHAIDMLLLLNIEEIMIKYKLKYKLDSNFVNYYTNDIITYLHKTHSSTTNEIPLVHILNINKVQKNVLVQTPLSIILKVFYPFICLSPFQNILTTSAQEGEFIGIVNEDRDGMIHTSTTIDMVQKKKEHTNSKINYVYLQGVGNKSQIIRIIYVSTMGRQNVRIENMNLCFDVIVFIKILKDLNFQIFLKKKKSNDIYTNVNRTVIRNCLFINGNVEQTVFLFKNFIFQKKIILNIYNSGTVCRFLLPLLCLYICKQNLKAKEEKKQLLKYIILKGDEQMESHRVINPLVNVVLKCFKYVKIKYLKKKNYLPICIYVKREIHESYTLFCSNDVAIDNYHSSQFVSSMLLISVYSETDTCIRLKFKKIHNCLNRSKKIKVKKEVKNFHFKIFRKRKIADLFIKKKKEKKKKITIFRKYIKRKEVSRFKCSYYTMLSICWSCNGKKCNSINKGSTLCCKCSSGPDFNFDENYRHPRKRYNWYNFGYPINEIRNRMNSSNFSTTSKAFIDLTVRVMKLWGVRVKMKRNNYTIKKNEKYLLYSNNNDSTSIRGIAGNRSSIKSRTSSRISRSGGNKNERFNNVHYKYASMINRIHHFNDSRHILFPGIHNKKEKTLVYSLHGRGEKSSKGSCDTCKQKGVDEVKKEVHNSPHEEYNCVMLKQKEKVDQINNKEKEEDKNISNDVTNDGRYTLVKNILRYEINNDLGLYFYFIIGSLIKRQNCVIFLKLNINRMKLKNVGKGYYKIETIDFQKNVLNYFLLNILLLLGINMYINMNDEKRKIYLLTSKRMNIKKKKIIRHLEKAIRNKWKRKNGYYKKRRRNIYTAACHGVNNSTCEHLSQGEYTFKYYIFEKIYMKYKIMHFRNVLLKIVVDAEYFSDDFFSICVLFCYYLLTHERENDTELLFKIKNIHNQNIKESIRILNAVLILKICFHNILFIFCDNNSIYITKTHHQIQNCLFFKCKREHWTLLCTSSDNNERRNNSSSRGSNSNNGNNNRRSRCKKKIFFNNSKYVINDDQKLCLYIDAKKDHRIIFMATILSLIFKNIIIDNSYEVEKSYPHFYEQARKYLEININYVNSDNVKFHNFEEVNNYNILNEQDSKSCVEVISSSIESHESTYSCTDASRSDVDMLKNYKSPTMSTEGNYRINTRSKKLINKDTNCNSLNHKMENNTCTEENFYKTNGAHIIHKKEINRTHRSTRGNLYFMNHEYWKTSNLNLKNVVMKKTKKCIHRKREPKGIINLCNLTNPMLQLHTCGSTGSIASEENELTVMRCGARKGIISRKWTFTVSNNGGSDSYSDSYSNSYSDSYSDSYSNSFMKCNEDPSNERSNECNEDHSNERSNGSSKWFERRGGTEEGYQTKLRLNLRERLRSGKSSSFLNKVKNQLNGDKTNLFLPSDTNYMRTYKYEEVKVNNGNVFYLLKEINNLNVHIICGIRNVGKSYLGHRIENSLVIDIDEYILNGQISFDKLTIDDFRFYEYITFVSALYLSYCLLTLKNYLWANISGSISCNDRGDVWSHIQSSMHGNDDKKNVFLCRAENSKVCINRSCVAVHAYFDNIFFCMENDIIFYNKKINDLYYNLKNKLLTCKNYDINSITIVLGGGIIEFYKSRQVLKKLKNVVLIKRNKRELCDICINDNVKPKLSGNIKEIINRRTVLFDELNSFHFSIPSEIKISSHIKNLKESRNKLIVSSFINFFNYKFFVKPTILDWGAIRTLSIHLKFFHSFDYELLRSSYDVVEIVYEHIGGTKDGQSEQKDGGGQRGCIEQSRCIERRCRGEELDMGVQHDQRGKNRKYAKNEEKLLALAIFIIRSYTTKPIAVKLHTSIFHAQFFKIKNRCTKLKKDGKKNVAHLFCNNLLNILYKYKINIVEVDIKFLKVVKYFLAHKKKKANIFFIISKHRNKVNKLKIKSDLNKLNIFHADLIKLTYNYASKSDKEFLSKTINAYNSHRLINTKLSRIKNVYNNTNQEISLYSCYVNNSFVFLYNNVTHLEYQKTNLRNLETGKNSKNIENHNYDENKKNRDFYHNNFMYGFYYQKVKSIISYVPTEGDK
ncbi:pentafunctional AROM polypeptide [Plasmodium brasilianum]|uniref:Pentafunctional AROM polypeptide n=1 Tax=Plasmodium brasilianum TaxID=5824 RepID=A0ACB9YEZ7_PLABR|nr:pentafunctional AROM polypeptide [Plasmodium brasilianum]